MVGLMSGTSADGIDAALVTLHRDRGGAVRFEELVEFRTVDMEPSLRRQVRALCRRAARVEELCRVNFALGRALARAALEVIGKAGFAPEQIDLIGSHGQTVRHLPGEEPPSTLQIGEPAVIASETGIVTIADFRPADVAVGGQGAPLVPLADYLLFGSDTQNRLLLNIGGISNLTLLPAGAGPDQVRAFDTGPGNLLIDAAVRRFTEGRESFDRNGERAARGNVDRGLLEWLMRHEFLRRPPPKSTGREDFGEEFFHQILSGFSLSEEDLIATLTAFTARSVAFGIRAFVLPETSIDGMWIGGGGVHNATLMRELREALPELRIASLAELGVPPDAREAVSFAVLADETLMGRPGNLPSATGASRAVVLGKIAFP